MLRNSYRELHSNTSGNLEDEEPALGALRYARRQMRENGPHTVGTLEYSAVVLVIEKACVRLAASPPDSVSLAPFENHNLKGAVHFRTFQINARQYA